MVSTSVNRFQLQQARPCKAWAPMPRRLIEIGDSYRGFDLPRACRITMVRWGAPLAASRKVERGSETPTRGGTYLHKRLTRLSASANEARAVSPLQPWRMLPGCPKSRPPVLRREENILCRAHTDG